MQNELLNWLGNSFQSTKVLFTSNLSTNGALMVQRGLAYSIAIEGSVPFWDKEKIAYRPLYPELTANSVLVWKKRQPFTLAAGKFIEHLKCFFFAPAFLYKGKFVQCLLDVWRFGMTLAEITEELDRDGK